MSKLKDKFQVAFNNETVNSNRVDKCEQIVDDFAIQFSKYVENLVIQDPQLYYASQTTELLQIFKSKYYE